MTPRVVFHPQARAELLEARDWYERRVPGLGAEFTRTVDGAVTAVARFPDGFAKVYGDFRQCRFAGSRTRLFIVKGQQTSWSLPCSISEGTRMRGGSAPSN